MTSLIRCVNVMASRGFIQGEWAIDSLCSLPEFLTKKTTTSIGIKISTVIDSCTLYVF